jgi:ribosomal protein S18 acetylase RimI-like enzyme
MTLILDPQGGLWQPGSVLQWPDELDEALLLEHPGHGSQKSHGRRGAALAALDQTRSVASGMEPDWASERHTLDQRGAPATATPGSTHVSNYNFPGAGPALSVVAYGTKGTPVGAFTGLLPGGTQQTWAFKIAVDPAAQRQGIGLQLLDAAHAAGFNLTRAAGVNVYTQAGRGLMQSWLRSRLTEAALLEHPGHSNQKSHGRRGSGVDVSGTQLAGISEKTRGKIDARAEKLGMPSVDQMEASLTDAYNSATPEQRKAGMEWYEDAHRASTALAEAGGFELDQVSAVMAVNSPTRHWDTNKAVGAELVTVIGKDEPFSIDAEMGARLRPPIAAGTYRPSDLTPSQVAFGHPGLRSGALAAKYGLSSDARSGFGRDHYGQMADGISVLRRDMTPDQALTGVKVRNFYNNIYDPRAGGVTVDDWAYKAALGDMPVTVRYSTNSGPQTYTGPASSAPYGSIGSLMQGSPVVKAEGYNAGLYPLVAEAYSRAASSAGVTASQMQAIAWIVERGGG